MEVNFSKRKKEGVIKFKLAGILSCSKCAANWKRKFMSQGKKVRVTKAEKGYEVWIA